MFLRRATARRAAIGLVAVLGALFVSAAPVAAECTSLDRWPSFRDAVPSARTIVIGVVVDGAPESWLNTFSLRVDEVLRGTEPHVMKIDRLQSGLPLTVCPSDSVAYVKTGDHLALALGALAPDGKTRINAVAYVQGSPDDFLMPGVERISAADIRELAGLPSTDAPAIEEPQPCGPPVPILLAAVLGAGAWMFRLRGRMRAGRRRAPRA